MDRLWLSDLASCLYLRLLRVAYASLVPSPLSSLTLPDKLSLSYAFILASAVPSLLSPSYSPLVSCVLTSPRLLSSPFPTLPLSSLSLRSSKKHPLHVVIDLGAIYSRIGLAGEDMPRIIMPSLVADMVERHDRQHEEEDKGKAKAKDNTSPLPRAVWTGQPMDACRPPEFSSVQALTYPLRSLDDRGVLCDLEGLRLLIEESFQKVRRSRGGARV